MSAAVAAATAITAALAVAAVAGVLHNRRSGVLRDTGPDAPGFHSADLGLSVAGPTILHFTAAWCGPCAAVRRVVGQVCAELPQVAHVEIDLDTNPAAAKALSVMSLPTTFVFDAEGRQRYRTAGVPKPADLKAAVEGLLA